MTTIPKGYGWGGSGLVPGGAGGSPAIDDTLRDVADDLAALKGGATLPALTSPPGSDAATVQTLVNEIRTKWNALAASGSGGVTLKTIKG